MPFTIGKCKLFIVKHTTLLEGATFFRNKHKIPFFDIKCTFFGRKKKTPLVVVPFTKEEQRHIRKKAEEQARNTF